jgi:hypothetical protein
LSNADFEEINKELIEIQKMTMTFIEKLK